MPLQCYAIENGAIYIILINNTNRVQPKVSGHEKRHGGRGIDFLDVKDLLYRHHASRTTTHIKYDNSEFISEEDLYEVQRSVSM